MKTLYFVFAVVLLASSVVAQKETPLPKDLPPYGAEKTLQAPNVKSFKLDNGLTVWLVSEPGFPKVAFSLAVRGGLAADPAERPGISELLSKTVDQGTTTRSAKQIAQELQATGGDLSVTVDRDAIQLSTAVLSSKLDPAMTVLADLVENASFPDAEVALAKRDLSDSLKQQESEPSFLARRAMAKVLFGAHPYHVTAPTQDSIAASTPADLRRVFAQRFRPDQGILVAVGDFQYDEMTAAVRAKFGTWKVPAEAPLAALPTPPDKVEHDIFIVNRPGSVQTTLDLSAFGPRMGDPDYEAAEVANAIYGGIFSSRLVANIREDKGYTYSPYSALRPLEAAGTLFTWADVRNEVTGPSLNEIEYELNRLATTSPTTQELGKSERYLVGNQAIRLQARAAVGRELSTIWTNGLPPEEIATSSRKIATTKSADVDAAARKYFPAYRMAIVAVGEETVIRDALAPLGIPMRTLP